MKTKTPSTLLKSLASEHEPQNYLKLLEKHVYPFLDRLPAAEKKSLIAVVTSASKDFEGVGRIDYVARFESITKGIEELKASVRKDWKHGYEEQGEMMADVAGEISSWLPILWTVGVEQGVEIELVHRCLKFCKASYDKLGNTNSRTEFSDMDNGEILIEDTKGKAVYQVHSGSIEHAILWIWRELLLSSIVNGEGLTMAKQIVKDMEKLELAADILERLDDEISGPPDTAPFPKFDTPEWKLYDWTAAERRDLLLNAHWSEATRSALPQAKELLLAGQIALFEKEPSANVFRTLVGAAPNLRDRLLASARSHFLPPKDNWTDIVPAFAIFKAAQADQDVLALLDQTIPGSSKSRFVDEGTILEAISYLMTRSPEVRSRTRPHLERGLRDRQTAVINEMERAFPTLPKAWGYLTEQVALGKISRSAPEEPPAKRPKVGPYPSYGLYESVVNGVRPRPADAARDPVLKKFCEAAGWSIAEYDSDEDDDEEEDDYGRGYGDSDEDEDMMENENNYQSRAEKEDAPLGIVTALQRWVKVLEQWPDVAERGVIKQAMRNLPTGGLVFYEVDGAADSLARR
ncbi:hypothetical protein HWV62_2049 [Athelia sp. TMB]|nr:hypothetical protein HWV62_2049 [Athelia sp. TMB]